MSIVLFLNMVLASALLSLLVLQRNDVLRMLILKTHLSVWQLLTLRFMGAASLFPAITALIIVLLMLAALLHRILWPILARPVYAVYRRGVIKQSKLLGTVGILSLSFAWPNNPLILLIGKLIRGS